MPTDSTEGRRATNWLAIDLAELAFELGIGRKSDEDAADFHFDVTIVGSGYGGAMVLNELAGYSENGQPLRIAMLERGSEYLPGAFPSRMSDLAGHVRFNTYGQSAVRGREAGLFDVRVGPDVGMLLASGLGGGSLINAGVMQAPLPSIFQDTRWPSAIRNDKTLGQQLEDVKTALEATSSAGLGSREAAMNALAGTSKSLPADITVARRDHPDRGVQACNECGDCATGCNFKAKLSVDVTLIAEACTRHDACRMRIVTGATVFTFRKLGPEGYELSVFHTDTELRRRQVKPFLLRSRKLILAAGTMGSTELLMRARSDGMPQLSSVRAVPGRRARVALLANPVEVRAHGYSC